MNARLALSKIKHVCSIGLNSHQLIPTSLKLLRSYVPGSTNMFGWVDDSNELDYIYSENVDFYRILPRYFLEHKNGHLDPVFDGWSKSIQFRNTRRLDELWKVSRSDFLKSRFYNEIFRPIGVFNGLCRTIRSGNKAEGTLIHYRTKNDPEFSEVDKTRVDTVARHIEYALRVNIAQNTPRAEHRSSTEIMMMDINEKVLSYSEGAEQLCMCVSEYVSV